MVNNALERCLKQKGKQATRTKNQKPVIFSPYSSLETLFHLTNGNKENAENLFTTPTLTQQPNAKLENVLNSLYYISLSSKLNIPSSK